MDAVPFQLQEQLGAAQSRANDMLQTLHGTAASAVDKGLSITGDVLNTGITGLLLYHAFRNRMNKASQQTEEEEQEEPSVNDEPPEGDGIELQELNTSNEAVNDEEDADALVPSTGTENNLPGADAEEVAGDADALAEAGGDTAIATAEGALDTAAVASDVAGPIGMAVGSVLAATSLALDIYSALDHHSAPPSLLSNYAMEE